MRHRVHGKQLSRSTPHRVSMRRNMAASLFQHGAIRTTEVKAKELRGFVEKLITTAKQGTLHARRRVIAELGRDRWQFDDEGDILDDTIVQKLFNEIAPHYADRPGGYTRIIRLGEFRIGDAGEEVILQLVGPDEAGGGAGGSSRRKARAAKRFQALRAAQKAARGDSQPEETAEPGESESDPASGDQQNEPAGEAEGEATSQTEGGDQEQPGEQKT
jgi:large subunit ribosomal protein L17